MAYISCIFSVVLAFLLPTSAIGLSISIERTSPESLSKKSASRPMSSPDSLATTRPRTMSLNGPMQQTSMASQHRARVLNPLETSTTKTSHAATIPWTESFNGVIKEQPKSSANIPSTFNHQDIFVATTSSTLPPKQDPIAKNPSPEIVAQAVPTPRKTLASIQSFNVFENAPLSREETVRRDALAINRENYYLLSPSEVLLVRRVLIKEYSQNKTATENYEREIRELVTKIITRQEITSRNHYHLSRKEVKETIAKMEKKLGKLKKQLLALAEEGRILEEKMGDILCIEKSFAPSIIRDDIQRREGSRKKGFKNLIETINQSKNPSLKKEIRSRAESLYYNATQKEDSGSKPFAFESELSELPNKDIIISHAQANMLSYYEECKSLHSSDIKLLSSHIEDSLREINKMLVEVSWHLKTNPNTIDEAYLLEHQDVLLQDKLFYEYALDYNRLVLNEHIHTTTRRLSKTIQLGFMLYSVGSIVHTQVQADSRQLDGPLQYEPSSRSDLASSQIGRDFLAALLANKNAKTEESEATPRLSERTLEITELTPFIFKPSHSQSIALSLSRAEPETATSQQVQNLVIARKEAAVVNMDLPKASTDFDLVFPTNILFDIGKQNLGKNFAEVYLEELYAHNPEISEKDYSMNMALLGLMTTKMKEITNTEACQEILQGMSNEVKAEALNVAQGMAVGAFLGIAGEVATGVIAPEILAAYHAGTAIYCLYKNSSGIFYNGAECVNAARAGDYSSVGEHLVRTALSAVAAKSSSKIVEAQLKNVPQVYTAFKGRFNSDLSPAASLALRSTFIRDSNNGSTLRITSDPTSTLQLSDQLKLDNFNAGLAKLVKVYGEQNVKDALNLHKITLNVILNKESRLANIKATARALFKINRNPRYSRFAHDNAHNGNMTKSSIHDESLTIIAGEKQGFLKNFRRASTTGIDYIDNQGRGWDVKTARSFSLEGKKIDFNVHDFCNKINDTILSDERVIINVTNLETDTYHLLIKTLCNNFNSEFLKKIIIIHQNDKSKSRKFGI